MTQVRSVDTPTYGKKPKAPTATFTVSYLPDEDIIEKALAILESRMRDPGRLLTNPTDVKDYMLLRAEQHKDVEVFAVVWLDANNRYLAFEELARGTLNQCTVYPREVIKSALKHQASACIVTHNHPSGNSEASQADTHLTRMLKDALSLIDVRLLDHIITAGNKAVSLAEMGKV